MYYDGGGGGRGGGGNRGFADAAKRGVMSREDRDKLSRMRSIAQQRKRECEKARVLRGKKEENYIIFVNKESNGFTRKEVIAEMLEAMEIEFGKVVSIQYDPETNSVVEVLLEKGVDVDIGVYNRVLTEKGFAFEVLSLGMRTEAVVIRKLHLTANPFDVVEDIKRSIMPFVQKILDVIPLKWKFPYVDKDQKYYKMLNGKLDGNYRITFVPKEDQLIPGYIPVGREKVRGEARYPNGNDKNLQCSNCYESNHLRGDEECTGGRAG